MRHHVFLPFFPFLLLLFVRAGRDNRVLNAMIVDKGKNVLKDQ